MLFRIGMGGVDEVEENIIVQRHLQSTFKSGDEGVGKFADKPFGVCKQDLLVVGKGEFACGGVECGKKLVLDKDICFGEGVEKGRLAGVGVADDGKGGNPRSLACAALRFTILFYLIELSREFFELLFEQAAVDFNLFLPIPRRYPPEAR